MSTTTDTTQRVVAAAKELRNSINKLDFGDAVPWSYNPLDYAWDCHRQYLLRFAHSECRVLFLGMNPGPWGMAQTGIPFGEIEVVKDWLGIDARIGKPRREHPKRPIDGLDCRRSEVSGKRLWGLFRDRHSSAHEFFRDHFVANYCPLVFMEESGRNLTPDKLPATARAALECICDRHLLEILELLSPQWVVGVGSFAENCSKRVIAHHSLDSIQTGRILHPSPASPAANRDWAGTASKQLQELGIW